MCSIERLGLKRARPAPISSTDPLPIYLDYNATTPLGEEAWAAMTAVHNVWGNPSSTHPYGMAAKYALEQARQKVANAIEAANAENILFTSGGTESNNIAIIGGALALHEKYPKRRHIISTTVEHPAVENVLTFLQKEKSMGFTTHRFPVHVKTGCVDVDQWRQYLLKLPGGPKTVALISVMHANNEIGSINPIKELVRMVKELCGPEVIFHTDAAQSIGKIPVNVKEMQVDLLSICSHKFYGPKGIGCLYVRDGIQLKNITFGAGHERGIRPGTENVLLATGMAEALHIACKNQPKNSKNMRETRDELLRVIEEELKKVGMWYIINGDKDCALPNTLNIALYRERNNKQRIYISAQGIILAVGDKVCMSAGSACHSAAEKVEVSSPLKGVGVDLERAVGTLRLSTGRGTTMEEVRRAARIIVRRAAQQFGDM
ncbi:cysteine desulfurase [Trypanosoma theileri]|uniref:cysteine desulfurase n=1 Tax=Trypanosoma theileri TaxID=67003 RepID=A0A1X0P5G5_9TRYP|nr:cysteine desulfurase [Trypanosoma theileri]ORC92186.1 cysteine desulfurase [Trypanosoma theileri]